MTLSTIWTNEGQFSLPPPYTKFKLVKKFGYTCPTLFVGWGEGLGMYEFENAPEMQKCLKSFFHDCRLQEQMILVLLQTFKTQSNS